MSVLAHVVLRGSLPGEPAATQALAHILTSSPDIARAFVAMLRTANVEFDPGYIGAELGREDSRPDLTVYDSSGRVRAFVENKFWAGLTDAQPVSYLAELPDEPPGALLFVVPQRRVATIWNELQLRCVREELEWVDGPESHSVIWARVDSKPMLITSWTHVLQALLQAAHTGGEDTIRNDILQLQGLTDRMDAEAFLPIRADEITDQETAHRLLNYGGLTEDITQKLKDNGVADTEGLRVSHSYQSAGRYLRVHGKFGLWLGIELEVWRDAGISPLWLMLDNGKFSGVAGQHQTIRDLFDDVQLYENEGAAYLPIRLMIGVERDRVISEAAAQITLIADTLQESFPDN